MLNNLPKIQPDANKYTRGSLLVLAGSERYPGAAVLCALAAARAGTGYVTLAVPEPVANVARSHLLSIPVIAAAACTTGSTLGAAAFAADALMPVVEELRHIDAIVCGPGMTIAPSTEVFLQRVVEFARLREIPLLLDADALNLLAKMLLQDTLFLPPNTILTPHAKEMTRLNKAVGVDDAIGLARKLNAIVVAKAPRTLIVSTREQVESASGTPALAKTGTGDVLAGIIASLLAQGMQPFSAAVAGVEIHSRAGCLAQQQHGIRSVMAEDIIAHISGAIMQEEKPQTKID